MFVFLLCVCVSGVSAPSGCVCVYVVVLTASENMSGSFSLKDHNSQYHFTSPEAHFKRNRCDAFGNFSEKNENMSPKNEQKSGASSKRTQTYYFVHFGEVREMKFIFSSCIYLHIRVSARSLLSSRRRVQARMGNTPFQ